MSHKQWPCFLIFLTLVICFSSNPQILPPIATPQTLSLQDPSPPKLTYFVTATCTLTTDTLPSFLTDSNSLPSVFCGISSFLILLYKLTLIPISFIYKLYFSLFTILCYFEFNNINPIIFAEWVKHWKSMMFWFSLDYRSMREVTPTLKADSI